VLAHLPQQQQPQQQPSASSNSSSTSNPLAIFLRVPDLQLFIESQELHVILISNPHGLLAVPYLQQLLQQKGSRLPLHLYCTEPCYHGFQHLALELLQVQAALQQQQQQGHGQQEQQQQQQQLLPQQMQLYQQQMQLHYQQLLAQQHTQQPLAAPGITMFQQQQQQQQRWSGANATSGVAWFPPQQQQQQQQQPAVVPGPIPPPAPPSLPPPQAQSLHHVPAPAAAAGPDVVPFFTQQQLQAVLDALQVVRCGQRLQLPGPWGLLAEARPAGGSIGAALWTLTAGSQR
jgi:hypothetical protein